MTSDTERIQLEKTLRDAGRSSSLPCFSTLEDCEEKMAKDIPTIETITASGGEKTTIQESIEKRLRFSHRFILTLFIFLCIFISKIFLFLLISFFILDYFLYRLDKTSVHRKQKSVLKEIGNDFSHRYKEEFEHQYKEVITKQDLKENRLSSLTSHRIRIPVIENFKSKFKVNHNNILDIGCSSGAFTKIYLNGQNKVLGLDMNLSSLEKARKNQVDVLLGNVLNLPLKNKSFDIINFCEVIEHLPNPLQALKEINRVLKHRGLLLLTTNNRCAISGLDIINPHFAFDTGITQ